jgi:hypothetical protein
MSDEVSEATEGSVDPPPQDKYWVVIVDDMEPPPPELRGFATFGEMVEFLRQVHKERPTVWILPFHGEPCEVKEGENRSTASFVVDHDGSIEKLQDQNIGEVTTTRGFYSPIGDDYIDASAISTSEPKEERRRVRPPRRINFDESSDLDTDF